MLDRELRTAILTLAAKGRRIREIARALGVSRNSVKAVLDQGQAQPQAQERASQLDAHLEEIRALHALCRGKDGRVNMVRVWEELRGRLEKDGKKLEASYQALTWFCRQRGIGAVEKVPAGRIVTAPGEEMQHDTSPHIISLSGKKVTRQCASLVLGYSRMLYVQYYPRFDRFQMKVFLTEAFEYFAGACRRCVIDNTSVALACGAGKNAEMAAEVEAFEERFGFHFLAHEIMHSDRKGKVERPHHFVERNFLVGRFFANDADLNRQLLEWLEKANRRRLREFKASPVELFAAEKPLLVPLPIYVPEVYRLWPSRRVDAYGCVSLHGFKYPAPAAYIDKEIMIRETKDRVILQDGHQELANHAKKIEGSPQLPVVHPCAPRRQKSEKLAEEGKLKALGEGMTAYLAALKAARGPRYFWSVRKLWRLLCQYRGADLLAAVKRAHEHGMFDVNRVETILLQNLAQNDYQLPLGFEAADCEKLPEYRQGAVTPEPDLNDYIPDPEEEDPNDQ
jgi:transposase